MDTDFKLFNVYNAPWIGTTFRAAPLSKVDDGTNDIVLQTGDKSRFQLAKLLIAMDNGDYFTKQGNTNKAGMGIQYVKSTEWTMRPGRKGPVPDGMKYKLPEGTQTFANEIYSIDGEKYPAQDITGRVLKQVLRIYY